MSASTPPLPASMSPFLGSFREVHRLVERVPGFVLLPVEVPGPDVGRALGDFLTREGRRATVIEPRDHEATWNDLVSALYGAEPEPRGVVILIGSDPPPAAARAGLRLLNQHQRHDTLSSRLGCPLIWCGSPGFLALCREEAPDFWATRATEIRLAEEPAPGALDTAAPRLKAAACSQRTPPRGAAAGAAERPGDAARDVLEAARARGDRAASASSPSGAAALVDALLAEGALDDAARVVAEALDSARGGGAAEPPAELLLRQATVERRRGHAVAAAATLGALLVRPSAAPAVRLRAELEIAGLLEDGGDLARAEASYREALALARQVGDAEPEARALIGAFRIAARTGRAAEAEGPLAEARAIAERLGDRALEASAVAAQALAAIGRHDAQKGRERISEAKALHAAGARQGAASRAGAGAERDVGPVDVLIVTSQKDELEAVLALGDGGEGEGGDRAWRERRDLGGFRYYRRTLPSARGGPLVVTAAWIGEAGLRTAAIRGQHLLAELDPACLAMCGVCFGDPRKVAPGDVIVADQLYSFDQGRRAAQPGNDAELCHDLRTFNLQAAWKMDAAYLARELDLSALSRARPPSRAAERRWLLHALHAHETEGGPTPVAHPERRRACPGWTARLQEALQDGLVSMKGGALGLTQAGREKVLEERLLYPDALPADPPLRVHVGAIASFTAAAPDPGVWDRLQRVVPGTLGLEAEVAAVGDLAARFPRRAILMRAAGDSAGPHGDDSLRAFACRASAAALLAFLQQHLAPEPRLDRPSVREPSETRELALGDDGERHPRERELALEERRDGLLDRVERVALLRDPAAAVTKHRAPPPFAGVLEVAVQDGRRVDVRVIGVLDRSITEELVTRYVTEVEHRFRQQDPYLRSTLVHTDPQAPPDLARSAARRGVVLKSFSEFQGLIDFGRYLAWQTDRIEADPSYPPWLYVEQPAVVSLGDREKSATESALDALFRLLDAPHRRFALVLGDFGAGKTFLLRELSRRMAREKHPLVPVLIELGRIEKQRSLDSLLAQHFALANEPVDLRAFRYMLAEGRIALLFDGFDELALRLTYDRALEHFDTVVQAAEGIAKVVVTSRTQHFLTDPPIKRELARRAEQLQGYRLVQLQGFGEKQIQRFLGNLSPEPAEAEARYRLLHEVKDLLGLSENPRMLGFIAKIEPDKLRQAKARTGTITAAKLYEVLVEQWLDHEHARANPRGAPRGIPRDALRAAMTTLARLLWDRNTPAVALGELPESLIKGAQPPDAPPLERAIIEHLIGSGSLLVRDADGAFSFVHRSALEWLVAEAAAREVKATGDSAALGADEMSELMVDFFVSLAGRGAAAGWAQRILHGAAEGNAKDNALRVARWLAKDDGARDDQGGEIRDDTDVVAGVNLAGQDLSGCNLACADLRKADLTQANLWSATLVEARLAGASLGAALLARADLTGADLQGADLRGADLSFARLVGADLTRADLTDAQLRGAKLIGARGVSVASLAADGAALAAEGAAPPRPREADPMWAPASPCNAVAWSRLGDLLAASHEDGSVRLWDAVTGQAIRAMHGHHGAAMSVAFSPDGLLLASGSSDRTVRLWEVATGRALRTFEGHSHGVRSVAWSPDGQTLASGSSDKTVRLWEVATGRLLRAFKGHTLGVRSVAFSPDGQTLASGSSDKTVRLWRVRSGHALRCLEGHTDWVLGVAWSPDGHALASGSSDRTVRLWDAAGGRALRAFAGHTDWVFGVAWSADGLTLASGSLDRSVRLWEPGSGRALRVLEGHTHGVCSVAFNPTGQTLASGSRDKTVRLWEVARGHALRSFEGHTDWVLHAAFSPDGHTLASAADDRTVRLWEVGSGRALRTFKGHTHGIRSVAFSPDGHTLASGSDDKTVRLWEVARGRLLRSFEGHAHAIRAVAFSPEGATLASASDDRTVRLWDIESGRALRTFEGHAHRVCSVAWSPVGLTLASGSDDKTMRLWEVARGRVIRTFEGHTDGIRGVAFSPDGLLLASGADDRAVRLWEVGSGRPLLVFEGHTRGVRGVAFNPSSQMLASGSSDKTVRLWDVQRGRVLRALEGHKASVQGVAFSPDGALLASASADGTLRLWDVALGTCLAILLPCPEGWAAFSPDGRYKLGGDIAGSFWHVIGLCRFEPGELDPYLPSPLRIPGEEPLVAHRRAGAPPANGAGR
ncbi:pentapeptide repeat-containing protein [Sorangium sp. So ce1389]|uniref:WD40 domain-containing protein n=1 Tax=Sorangium sp. So ce1389 TaxID=3133336 RepID=UPI003F644CC5